MRLEKKYLAEEVKTHLDKSDYVYLTNYGESLLMKSLS